MSGSNSTDGQRSGTFIESLQNPPLQIVPTLKQGKEDEELRRKRLAQKSIQKEAREASVWFVDSRPVDDIQEGLEMLEPQPNDDELDPVSAHDPVGFLVELATVAVHEDIDHLMAEALDGPESVDIVMEEAPPLRSVDVVMEEAPPLRSVDVVMEEAPPLRAADVVMEDAPPLRPGEE